MADAAAPKVKKATKPKVPAAHPPYAAMIAAAIKGLGDKKGSSRQAILKHVVANNKVDAAKAAVRVRLALKKMIAAKKVVAAAAAGKKGAGSFKLAVVEKKAKKVKKLKAKKPKKAKKAAKKPAAHPKYSVMTTTAIRPAVILFLVTLGCDYSDATPLSLSSKYNDKLIASKRCCTKFLKTTKHPRQFTDAQA